RALQCHLLLAQGLEVAPPVHQTEVALLAEQGRMGAVPLGRSYLRLEEGTRFRHDRVALRRRQAVPARPVDRVHLVQDVPALEPDGGVGHGCRITRPGTRLKRAPDVAGLLPRCRGRCPTAYGAQFAQQVTLVPTLPPAAMQPSEVDLILHRAQSAFDVQATVGSPVQAWVTSRSQVPSTGMEQVTNPALPHVERAAQRFTLPLQLTGMVPASARDFTMWATQLTYCPWLSALPQSHWALMAACTAQRAGSQSVWARAAAPRPTRAMAVRKTVATRMNNPPFRFWYTPCIDHVNKRNGPPAKKLLRLPLGGPTGKGSPPWLSRRRPTSSGTRERSPVPTASS